MPILLGRPPLPTIREKLVGVHSFSFADPSVLKVKKVMDT